MSQRVPTEDRAPARAATAGPGWRVREAGETDLLSCATAVEALLDELGGRKPTPTELLTEVEAAFADRAGASLLVAESEAGEVVGVLSASWGRAIHVPGPYATIQDLWVHPEWRSRRVGAGLVEGMAGLCRERGVARIEVGLPRETFAAIDATRGFYERNGFAHLGPRMRRLLDQEEQADG
ncbi:MAG: GNAT family N-acetyltransferase [Solirubrobacterales bacterium]